MKYSVIILSLLCLYQTAHAEDFGQYASELGGSLGSGTVNNMMQPAQYTPRYTDNVPMAEQYYGGGGSLPTQFGDAKFNDCKNLPANPDLYLRQECEGVNLIAGNRTKRPDVTVSANEKLVTGTQKIAGDPAETLEKYKWQYPVNADGSIGTVPSTACPTEKITVPAIKSVKHCSEYTGAELFLCEAALKVKVDPNWNYSCLETKYQNNQYQCSKKLKVICEQAPDCTTAGVEAGSLQGDMQVSFTKDSGESHKLVFGSIGNNYFSEGQYDRELLVKIKNLKKLSDFTLRRVEYDDWLVVKVNDTIVYSSYENKMLYTEFYSGHGIFRSFNSVYEEGGKRVGIRERNESWKKELNLDIRPYLKEGNNTIWTRTIVGGNGENALIFSVHQYCDSICTESWEDGCKEYEEKVK